MSTLIDPDPIVPAPKVSPIDRLENLNPMQRYLVHEFVEDYRDGLMSRRDLLSRVVHIAGGVAAGLALLAALGVSAEEIYAQESTPAPQQLRPNPRVPYRSRRMTRVSSGPTSRSRAATRRSWPTRRDQFLGWRQRRLQPARRLRSQTGGTALVLVCHENRGLTEHIRDVTRRLAVAGYTACAVDLVSREGGTDAIADPSDDPRSAHRRETSIATSPTSRPRSPFTAMTARSTVARVGMTGFCFGGGITWRTATQTPELMAPQSRTTVRRRRSKMCRTSRRRSSASTRTIPDDFANEGRDELAAALDRRRRHVPDPRLPGHPARLPQRHRPALQRGAGPRGVGRHARLVRGVSRRLTCAQAKPARLDNRRRPGYARRLIAT